MMVIQRANHTLAMAAALSALLLFAGAMGCGSSGPKSPYPPPDTLKAAPVQRQDFVNSFLRGQWCESDMLFEESQENFLRQDKICQVSYNYLLAWKLHRYVELDRPELLEKARYFAEIGFGCPDNPSLPDDQGQGGTLSDKDQAYLDRIQTGDYKGLLSALSRELDPLFVSVYCRKAAKQAMERGQREAAATLVERARETDAAQGWVSLLVEDWKLEYELASSEERRKAIALRMEHLQTLIVTCPEEEAEDEMDLPSTSPDPAAAGQ